MTESNYYKDSELPAFEKKKAEDLFKSYATALPSNKQTLQKEPKIVEK